MIEVKDISVRKGKNQIIKKLSLRIRPGKITVVVGNNGAGKTTLLESLTGANPVEEGEIIWDRISLNKMNLKNLAQRRAVLSQSVKVNFPVIVSDLVKMGTYVADEKLPEKKINTLVDHALKDVELFTFKDRVFNTLSGGEQKRVLLAKCLVQLNCCNWANINKYIFLDEPTASLDIQQQYKLIEKIKYLVKRRNIGVFAIFHDINLAAQFADEILMLNSGKLIKRGSPKEVLTSENLETILGIHAIVQPHPLYDCPHITTIPYSVKKVSA